ncbi:MAG TPA: hypothetical protein VIZ90_04980 [Rhizobiaceae bacterium]
MMVLQVLQRVTEDERPGAVTLIVYEVDGQPVGDISWPAYTSGGLFVSPAMGNPAPMPGALQRAIATMQAHGLDTVVINIEDRSLWNDNWGTLQD